MQVFDRDVAFLSSFLYYVLLNFQVYITDPLMSDWLQYNSTALTLEGVPSIRHHQSTHNVIVTLLRDDFIKLTIPCAVHVVDDVTYNDVKKLKADSQSEKSARGLRCAPNEPLVVLSVTLNVTQEQLNAKERIQIIVRSCDFLRQYVTCDDVILSVDNHGNVTSYVKVSWSVACGAESVGSALLQFVGTAEKNGYLSDALGFSIITWRIENKKQFSSSSLHEKKFALNNRLKRCVILCL